MYSQLYNYIDIYILFFLSLTKVSATFAASLVSSPAIGAYLGRVYSEELVVALATAIAFLDICFILACVPESLSEKVRIGHLCSVTTLGGPVGKFSWGKADPFAVRLYSVYYAF